MNLGWSLVFSLLSGLTIILGGWIFASKKNWESSHLDFFIALGAGFILAVALLDMIPEAFASSPYSMTFVIFGYLIVHLFEHVVTPHFHFGEETHTHLISNTVSTSALIGLMVHNFFSGVAIGSGMLTGYQIGLVIFVGTLLHKLPEGFTISSIMFASHHRRRHGVIGTILLALSSLLGTALIYSFNMEQWPVKDFALSVSAGTFIHVATTDLIPRINDSKERWMPLVVFLGVGLFWVSSLVVRH